VEIKTSRDLVINMQNIKGSELGNLKTRVSEISKFGAEIGEEDLFDEDDESASVCTPPNTLMSQPSIKKVGSTKVNFSKVPNYDFPSSKDMVSAFNCHNVPVSSHFNVYNKMYAELGAGSVTI